MAFRSPNDDPREAKEAHLEAQRQFYQVNKMGGVDCSSRAEFQVLIRRRHTEWNFMSLMGSQVNLIVWLFH